MDHVLYHLDGPQAIKHMDALMEIDGIDALQWTSGDAGPDGTLPDWDVIYDKAIAAGKSIWVKVYSGEFEDWIRNVDRLVKNTVLTASSFCSRKCPWSRQYIFWIMQKRTGAMSKALSVSHWEDK